LDDANVSKSTAKHGRAASREGIRHAPLNDGRRGGGVEGARDIVSNMNAAIHRAGYCPE